MGLIIVASQHSMAVRIHDVDAPEGVEPAFAVINGSRAPGSVEGYGLTYDVDQAMFDGWTAANPEVAQGMKITTEDEIAAWQDTSNRYGYELGLSDEAAPPTEAPSNTTVPHVTQTGNVLNCTMGNWTGEPTAYAYQWKIDGTNVGTDAPDYTATAGDVGKVATCIVTATNAAGSTAAPPSADVVVAA